MAWNLDDTHTRIGFAVRHMMVSTVRGEFKKFTGTLDLDEQDFTKSRIAGEIETASIDTGVEQRDEHLRSADFFDAANHPLIRFESRRIEHVGGSDYKIVGDLTIRGTTREIVLDAEYGGTLKNPYGMTVTGVSATATLDRKDFGLVWNAVLEAGGLTVADKVKLELEFEAVQVVEPALATASA